MGYRLSKPIAVAEYDPQWPLIFEAEKARVLERLSPIVIDIEHFGSTSVPGLGAKPIIDLLAAVRHLEDIARCVEPLRRLGYEDAAVYLGYWIVVDRRLFCKGPYNEGTHHLHLVQHGSETWIRNLQFRDHLRTHPEAAQQYLQLKKKLAETSQADINSYTDGKTDFVRAAMELASG